MSDYTATSVGEGNTVEQVFPMGFPWKTFDPFLFTAHHLDRYPRGNAAQGVDREALMGRHVGHDFTPREGWRMYHGQEVPGFPQHPHRGFETITIARQGFVDHTDSMGASSRFGQGDVQWMTAGRGVVHSEMFPLVNDESGNTTELFQIWLNLPRDSKMVEPAFMMIWDEEVARVIVGADDGPSSEVRVIAGNFGDARGRRSPPDSWAADPKNHVTILTIEMEAGAELELPADVEGLSRTLYFHAGENAWIADVGVQSGEAAKLRSDRVIRIQAGDAPASFVLLQGRPISEPVAQQGPFVMNTPAEIQKAMTDYYRTQFGGWPWPKNEMVHARDAGRFADHGGGRVERPGS